MTIIAFPKQNIKHFHNGSNDKPEETKASWFSISAFWNTIKRYASKLGVKIVATALTLYYVFAESTTPFWAKALIGGALAYLIMPIDMIPDFLPGGFVDDASLLLATLSSVRTFVSEVITSKAHQVAGRYFGYEDAAA